ncbi:MAG: DUF4363 family protein [Clostridiales bacterium]|nr:DUF4363 family protein [Clostridiales bacterium]
MVRSIVSIICASVIIFFGVLYEGKHIDNTFNELNLGFHLLYDKIDEQTATSDDVLSIQKLWLEKKKSLHVFIPHTEIKEFDMWLSETVTLVRDKEWADAISKLEVLIELSEQIPLTFKFRLGNIF